MDDTAGRVENRPVDNVDRRTAEIRREIDQTREELSETVEAIQDKLRPANIVANATGRAREAATEGVRHMRETVGLAANSVISRTGTGGLRDHIRDNPWPVALMGVSVAWWLINARSNARVGHYREPDGRWQAGYDERYPVYGEASSRTGPPTSESMSQATHAVASRAQEYAHDASSHIRQTGHRAQSELERMTRDNPLAVGAGALLLGTIVGLLIPQTERENHLLGGTRDNLVDRAQSMARDMASRAEDAAVDAVGDAAGRIVGSPGE